jgi:predicted  nucleic acid-binding Zn-ribbon protein
LKEIKQAREETARAREETKLAREEVQTTKEEIRRTGEAVEGIKGELTTAKEDFKESLQKLASEVSYLSSQPPSRYQ